MGAERTEPERVEIELTPRAPDRRRGHRGRRVGPAGPPSPGPAWGESPSGPPPWEVGDASGPTDVEVTSAIAADAAVPGSDRRRLVVAALAAGVLGLTLGAVLGRSGGSSELTDTADPVAAATTTSPRATPSTVLAGEPLPSVAQAPTTTEQRRTLQVATTTVPAVVTERVAVTFAAYQLPYEVVGLTNDLRIEQVDLEHGTVTVIPLPDASGEGAYVGRDWIAVPKRSGGIDVVRPDGSITEIAMSESWGIYPIGSTGRFWRADVDYPSVPVGTVFEEVTIDGEPTGARVDLGGLWPNSVDPAGGMVVQVAGAYFSIRPDGTHEPIGAGELLALDETVAVFRRCADQLECRIVVVDRATGDERVVVTDPPIDSLSYVSAPNLSMPTTASSVSPDHRWCAIVQSTPASSHLTLVDLVTGRMLELGEFGWIGSIAWSPDGNLAFYLDQVGRPQVVDLVSGDVAPLSTDLDRWMTIDVRPRPES